MGNNVKLVWEYRGPNSMGIAKHQVIHLKEYCQNNEVNYIDVDIEQFQANVWFAFLIVKDEIHVDVAKNLRPRFVHKMNC